MKGSLNDRYRIKLYWTLRHERLHLAARRIHRLLQALAPLHPGLAEWRFGGEAVTTEPQCHRALEASLVEWGADARGAKRTSYVPSFAAAGAKLEIACGITVPDMESIWIPNRLELMLQGEVATRESVESAMRSAIRHFEPEWAFAGTATVPQAPLAIFSTGAPVVGWMTYLSSAYPPAPLALPTPAVSYVEGTGTLIVAHPKRFDPGHPEHAAAVEAVRARLEGAGVLLSHRARLAGRAA